MHLSDYDVTELKEKKPAIITNGLINQDYVLDMAVKNYRNTVKTITKGYN